MAINGRSAEFSVCVAKSTYRYIIHGTGFNPEDTKTFLGRGVTLLLDPAIQYCTVRVGVDAGGRGACTWAAFPKGADDEGSCVLALPAILLLQY